MKVKVILAENDNYNGTDFFCLGVVKTDKREKEIKDKSNADHIWTEEFEIED
jgi:hypothetical protein